MISPDVKDKALELYEKGMSKSAIAKKLNISRDSVTKICKDSVKESNIENEDVEKCSHPTALEVNDELGAKIFKELKTGKDLATIVIDNKLNPDIVQRYFDKYQQMKGVDEPILDDLQDQIEYILSKVVQLEANIPITRNRLKNTQCGKCGSIGTHAVFTECKSCSQQVWW